MEFLRRRVLSSVAFCIPFFFKEININLEQPRVFRMNILKIASNLWRPLNCILYDNTELQLILKNKTGTHANNFQANIPSLYQKKTIYFLGNVIYWCLFKHFINFSTKQSEINKERFFGGARILHLMVFTKWRKIFASTISNCALCFYCLVFKKIVGYIRQYTPNLLIIF